MKALSLKISFLFGLTVCSVLPKNISAAVLQGSILNTEYQPIVEARVLIEETKSSLESDKNGKFEFSNLPEGTYTIIVSHKDFRESLQKVTVTQEKKTSITVILFPKSEELKDVEINISAPLSRGKEISEDQISIGKNKIVIKQNSEKGTSSSLTRTIDAPVNIIEYDGAGLQLGIGGRGLNPKRTSHYNTRQNGYEISADALGYPETYYTPPGEAIREISILRGAASLQFGPQFGGMINFILKDGPSDSKKKFEVISNNRVGSYNQFHTFNSVATRSNKLKTYSFYHYKTGDGWRDNSSYDSHTAYTGLSFQPNKKFNIRIQFTKYFYVAQQAGGLTDKQFEENPQESFRQRNWFNIDWNIAALIMHYKFNSNSWINSKTFYIDASRNSVGFLQNPARADPLGNRLLITGDFKNIGNETRWINRYKIKNKSAALISGVRLYRGWAETSQSSGGFGSDPNFTAPETPENSQYIFPSRNLSAFLENTFFISKKLYLTPGYRFEYIETETDGYLNRYFINNVNDTLLVINEEYDFSRDRHIHLYGTGLTYNIGKKSKIIANISKNFRSVNFSDININIPSLRVDTLIEDEKGYTADLTFSKSWNKKAFLSITGYLLHYSNRIGVIWKTDEDFNTYQFRTNISASRTLGIEATNWLNLGEIISFNDTPHQLNLMTNITANYAKYIDTNALVYGNLVEMVPGLTVKSSLSYEYKNWLLSGLINFQTAQFSEASNAIKSSNGLYGIIPSFYVIDAKTGYDFNKIILQFSINNLTNNYYFTQRANSYPGPGIIPSEGRTYWLSVIFKLTDKKRIRPKVKMSEKLEYILDGFTDTDQDGIMDTFDKDNQTPADAKTTGDGMAMDTDGDGVPDYLDQERLSVCTDVDENGVALDNDGDNVPNCKDAEPNTEDGSQVDITGKKIRTVKASIANNESHIRLPSIYFSTGSAKSRYANYPALTEVAKFMKNNKNARLNVVGHTDNSGPQYLNKILREKRAQAAVDLLVKIYGIDASRLTVVSVGYTDDIAPISASRVNRRVDFLLEE